MKTLSFILSVIAIALAYTTNAQEQITVKQSQITVPSGNVAAYSVIIPQAMQPVVLKDWSRLVINETGRKSRKKPVMTKSEYSIDSVFIKQIAEEPLNITSSFMQKENGVEMLAAFNYKGLYLDSSNQVMNERASNYIRNFALGQYRDAVKFELENEKEKLEAMNEKLAQLVKENTKYKKNIASYTNDTIDLKQEIILQNKLKESKNQEIYQQEMNVSRAKGDPVNLKEQKKKLNAMKQDRKQISNKIKKNDKQIVSKVSDIENSKRQITLNEQEQERQKQAIESQMKVVEQVKEKLDRIK